MQHIWPDKSQVDFNKILNELEIGILNKLKLLGLTCCGLSFLMLQEALLIFEPLCYGFCSQKCDAYNSRHKHSLDKRASSHLIQYQFEHHE